VLKRAHDRAVKASAKRVCVDFTDLKFMSAACFKQFVTWVSWIEQIASPKRYKIHITFNSQHRWQRTSLNALQAFAIGTLSFE